MHVRGIAKSRRRLSQSLLRPINLTRWTHTEPVIFYVTEPVHNGIKRRNAAKNKRQTLHAMHQNEPHCLQHTSGREPMFVCECLNS